MALFAHGATAGGPNFEALALAIPLVVVGVVLFVQKSAKPVVSVMLVLAGITLALGSFTFLGAGDDHDNDEGAQATDVDDRYAHAVDGLCDSRQDLADGNVAPATESFFDSAHAPLHEIADRLSDRDRAAAADLLEAKQAFEAGIEANEGSVSLSRGLDRLIIATVVGLNELDVDVTGCA